MYTNIFYNLDKYCSFDDLAKVCNVHVTCKASSKAEIRRVHCFTSYDAVKCPATINCYTAMLYFTATLHCITATLHCACHC